MESIKQEVGNLLKRLPDDCSLEDVQYHLYVLQKIERGMSDVKNGRVFSVKDAEKRMEKWLGK